MSVRKVIPSTSREVVGLPVATIEGTDRTSVSASLWTDALPGAREVQGRAADTRHSVCVSLARYRKQMFVDDRFVFDRPVPLHAVNIVGAGSRHRAIYEGPWRMLSIHVPVDLVVEAAIDGGVATSASAIELIDPGASPDPLLARIARDMHQEILEPRPLSRLRMDGLGMEVAVQLLRAHSNLSGAMRPDRPPARGGLTPAQMRRSVDYLHAHLAEDVSLVELAAVTGLSPFHFARSFKQSTGLPPQAYLRRIRAEKARELLLGTALPIGDIALAVGYETPQAFARMFRAEVGVSPSDYRAARAAPSPR